MKYETYCNIRIHENSGEAETIANAECNDFAGEYPRTFKVLSNVEGNYYHVCYEKQFSDDKEFNVLYQAAEAILLGELRENFLKRAKNEKFLLYPIKSEPEVAAIGKINKKQEVHLDKALELLSSIGILHFEKSEKATVNFRPRSGKEPWEIIITNKNPGFLIHNGWFELYVAGEIKKAAKESGLQDDGYELTHGVKPYFLKNAITDVDIMLAFNGKALYVETKTSNYRGTDGEKDLVDDIEKFAENIEIFGIPKDNACFVCLNKNDSQLKIMREKAARRFHVQDNRTFPTWIKNRITYLKNN